MTLITFDADLPTRMSDTSWTMDNGSPLTQGPSNIAALPILTTANWSDFATLSCATALAAAPATNLQRMQPTTLMRTTTTFASIIANRGSPQYFNLVSLLFTNATALATVRVRSAVSEAGLTSGAIFDSGMLQLLASATTDARRHSLLFLANPIYAQWVQIDVADPTNPDGYLNIGRLYIANAHQFTRNFDYGVGMGFVDRSTLTRSKAGLTFPTRAQPAKTIGGRIGFQSEDEVLSNMYEIELSCGLSRDALLISDPTPGVHRHKKIAYGLLTKLAPIVNSRFNLFDIEIDIEGLL